MTASPNTRLVICGAIGVDHDARPSCLESFSALLQLSPVVSTVISCLGVRADCCVTPMGTTGL